MIFMYLRFITRLLDIHIPREMMTTARLSNISCVCVCVCVCMYDLRTIEIYSFNKFPVFTAALLFCFFHFIFNFNWRIIALQCCVGFCRTIK